MSVKVQVLEAPQQQIMGGLRGGKKNFIKTCTGKTITVDVNASDTPDSVKVAIEDTAGTSSSQMPCPVFVPGPITSCATSVRTSGSEG